jgi:hypothetical protein
MYGDTDNTYICSSCDSIYTFIRFICVAFGLVSILKEKHAYAFRAREIEMQNSLGMAFLDKFW